MLMSDEDDIDTRQRVLARSESTWIRENRQSVYLNEQTAVPELFYIHACIIRLTRTTA